MILKVQIWGKELGMYQIKVKVKLRGEVPKNKPMPFCKNIPGKNHTKMLGAELSTTIEYLMMGKTNVEVFILLLYFLNRTDF